MVKLDYNPFQKNFDDIAVEDLAQLRQVAEGWYIEYKGTTVPAKNIAKSLSAFANHYGGWIFYGVEGDKGSNLAIAFPGLDKKDTANLIENIRNASKDSVNPSPYYEYKVLSGPCQDTGLAVDRHIIIVGVPSSHDTPHVHIDGRIYRRVADSSDPRPEHDRFILDRLWERRRKSENVLASLLTQTPTISEAEKANSFMHIFLLHDPMNLAKKSPEISFEKFVEIMSSTTTETGGLGIQFDNFFTMSNGMIARQIATNDPSTLVVTWKHYDNGCSMISANIKKHPSHPSLAFTSLQGYKYTTRFVRALREQRHEYGYLLDFHLIILLIISFIDKHILLLQERGILDKIFVKVSFTNIWRTIPFFDTESFMNFVEKRGLPVVQYSEALTPEGITFEELARIEVDAENKDIPYGAMQWVRSVSLITQVGNTLGIPSHVLFTDDPEWYEAIMRARPMFGESANQLSDDSE